MTNETDMTNEDQFTDSDDGLTPEQGITPEQGVALDAASAALIKLFTLRHKDVVDALKRGLFIIDEDGEFEDGERFEFPLDLDNELARFVREILFVVDARAYKLRLNLSEEWAHQNKMEPELRDIEPVYIPHTIDIDLIDEDDEDDEDAPRAHFYSHDEDEDDTGDEDEDDIDVNDAARQRFIEKAAIGDVVYLFDTSTREWNSVYITEFNGLFDTINLPTFAGKTNPQGGTKGECIRWYSTGDYTFYPGALEDAKGNLPELPADKKSWIAFSIGETTAHA